MADYESDTESIDEDFELKCNIISHIQNYPSLYNKQHPEHYRKDKKQIIMQKIADELGITG